MFDWYDADKNNSLKLADGRVEFRNGATELTEEEWSRHREAGKTFEKAEQETIVLKAEILPETAVNRKLTWHSDNENIAVCTDGKITALSKGSCVVTAETGNGVKASCVVTVYELNRPAIPEKLKAKDRIFSVIRMHQGQAEKLPTVMNPDGTVSFEIRLPQSHWL